MARTKPRREILFTPSITDVFSSLSSMPSYSRILRDAYPEKKYSAFLDWLLGKDFLNSREEKISIKKIALECGSDPGKVTKWLKDIYQDIFEINYDKPELFRMGLIGVILHANYFDNACTFTLALPVAPREHEEINFYFLKAKMGIETFWVKSVEHQIEQDQTTVVIRLEGGYANRYREFILDKAMFHNEIGIMDLFNKHSYEIDEMLKRLYRS